MSFDISLAFDTAEYLNPQLYLFTNTLKDKLPKDTIVHIVTDRDEDDEVIEHMKTHLPIQIHYNEGKKTRHLKSRCRYMFNCFDVETDKPWLMKMELDMLILKHLDSFNALIKEDWYDIAIESENRKIFDDATEERLWKLMYRAMGIKKPEFKIKFRENNESGLPLFGTGIILVNTRNLDTINSRWVELTEKVEPWLKYNVHPNEQAFTAMTLDERWAFKVYPPKYKFNPIGHFRKGSFPSTQLIDNCILPEDTVIFDYHRPEWLYKVAMANPKVMQILVDNKEYIPDDWWNLPREIWWERMQ